MTTTKTDDLLTGTVVICSIAGGNIFIVGDNGKTYYSPVVLFPKIPRTDFRAAMVGSQVKFRLTVGPDGQPVTDEHDRPEVDVVEAHIGASYVLPAVPYTEPTIYRVDRKSIAHVTYAGEQHWFATDLDGSSLPTFSVMCMGQFKAYRVERSFDDVHVTDKLGTALFLDNKKNPINRDTIATRTGVRVPVGTYVLFVYKSGRVVIHRLARRSIWEGEGPAPYDKSAEGWTHWLVIEYNRLVADLDPELLKSGDAEAIANAIPGSGLGLKRDNDGFAGAIAEAGSYIQN